MKRKLFTMGLMLIIGLFCGVSAAAAEEVVVYYTNDIHSYISNGPDGWTYSKIAALTEETPEALLVDAGDHLQGTAYGGMDNGATIIELMNAADYDVATLGNHEFDYGMAGCMTAIENADFPYVSCNFRHEENGTASDLVLDSFHILESGGKKLAFVGITTPETITSAAPAYFQDENGNYIYGIDGGADGSALYTAVQQAIDAAEAAGADYIIALGHLGVDPSSGPWTSRNVIANTIGLDAFIDGHSHTTIIMEEVMDQAGDAVILTQTGSYLNAVGKLTISADGTVTTELLTAETVSADTNVKAIEDAWIKEVDGQLGQVIGYAEITLDNYNGEERLVRKQGTNSGEFAADALYYLFDKLDLNVDVAVVNGGGIRNEAITGELTYLSCKQIHSFGNVACLLEVTGQQLLDALEWGSKGINAEGTAENGSLLHTAGLKYTLDLSYDSTVQADEKDVWTGPPTGAYRVKQVQVLDRESGEYVSLDMTKTYRLAGHNYTLRDLGGGFNMLKGAVNVLDYVAEDYMVLADYIRSFSVDERTGLPTITEKSGYTDVYGSGRITILRGNEEIGASEETEMPTAGEYVIRPGDSLWKIAKAYYGSGRYWEMLYEANEDRIADPDLIFVGQVLCLPAA